MMVVVVVVGWALFVLVLVAAETDSSPRPERLAGGFGDLSAPETGLGSRCPRLAGFATFCMWRCTLARSSP